MRNCLWVFLVAFTFSAYAHKPVKVQTLEDAVAKYTAENPEFEPWVEFKDVTFLKSATIAKVDDFLMVKFMVKADWGPIHGLAVIKGNQVAGMEILVYTEHEGAGVSHPVFLDQFEKLTLENHKALEIKPLPKEPKTSLALREVISVVFTQANF